MGTQRRTRSFLASACASAAASGRSDSSRCSMRSCVARSNSGSPGANRASCASSSATASQLPRFACRHPAMTAAAAHPARCPRRPERFSPRARASLRLAIKPALHLRMVRARARARARSAAPRARSGRAAARSIRAPISCGGAAAGLRELGSARYPDPRPGARGSVARAVETRRGAKGIMRARQPLNRIRVQRALARLRGACRELVASSVFGCAPSASARTPLLVEQPTAREVLQRGDPEARELVGCLPQRPRRARQRVDRRSRRREQQSVHAPAVKTPRGETPRSAPRAASAAATRRRRSSPIHCTNTPSGARRERTSAKNSRV